MDAVIRRGMTRDFSWQKAAGAYEELYQGML
jgi:glycogen synthase